MSLNNLQEAATDYASNKVRTLLASVAHVMDSSAPGHSNATPRIWHLWRLDLVFGLGGGGGGDGKGNSCVGGDGNGSGNGIRVRGEGIAPSFRTGSPFVDVCEAPCKGGFLKCSPVLSLLIPLQETSRRRSIRYLPL